MTHKALPFLLLWIFACGGETNNSFPSSASDAPNDADDGNSGVSCGEVWTTNSDDVSVQPNNCLQWSTRSSDKMNWYAAASPEDGAAGNCGTDCPQAGDGHCENFGPTWRLPSVDEIKSAAQTQPDINNVDGWLWSRDTSSSQPELALTADLSRGGTGFEKDKTSSEAWVRCVSND